MSPCRAIIADDEAPLRDYLKTRLARAWPELRIVGEAENGPKALDLIRAETPDVAFLDIRMPGLSGMEVARRIAGACRVVFITAYDEHAVEAFEHEAVDYLLKPVTVDRLEKTVARLKARLEEDPAGRDRFSERVERLVRDLEKQGEPETLQWIRARVGEDIRLIPVDDVCYFQAEDKYTRVVTQDREALIRKPIRQLVLELDSTRFWQIHRGTIVNARSIARVRPSITGGASVRLKDREEILTASRRFAGVFRQM